MSEISEYLQEEEGWIYLDAVILIKCYDPDGNVKYREIKTPDLSQVEALGMVETYSDSLRSILMRKARRSG